MQIIVLGMHRSGTSAVSRLLNMMGAYFAPPEVCIGSNQQNPKGFWERRDVRNISDQLLHSIECDWHKISQFSFEKIPEETRQKCEKTAREIVADLGIHRPWFMKEPRLCLLLPFWLKIIEKPVIVYVVRKPLQVAQSLKARNGLSISHGIALWEFYNLQALRHSRNLPLVTIRHDKLMESPRAEMERLLQGLEGCGVTGLQMPPVKEVEAFIDPYLFRQRGDDELQKGYLNQAQQFLADALDDGSAFTWDEIPEASLLCLDLLASSELAIACEEGFRAEKRKSQSLSESIASERVQMGIFSEVQANLVNESNRLQTIVKSMAREMDKVLGSSRWKWGGYVLLRNRYCRQSERVRNLLQEFSEWKVTQKSRRLQMERLANNARNGKNNLDFWAEMTVPTVVVPIFNAFEEVRECLQSLVRCEGAGPHRILLIDDHSSDQRIWPLLEEFAGQHPHVTALRNETNLGYTSTINRGCESCTGDVILLNSDTLVTPRWIEKLLACAYSEPRVATVTAISNAAGAFSVPSNHQVNQVPTELGVDGMALLVEGLSRRFRPNVPTGNGFCMFVRREALKTVGLFDASKFPKGYGEENDFCMRADIAGFVNLVDDATFIYHHRTASFGADKQSILTESKAVLKRLYPDYSQRVADWQKNDPLDGFRRDLKEALSKTPASETDWQTTLGITKNASTPTIISDGKRRGALLVVELFSWHLYQSIDGRMVRVESYCFKGRPPNFQEDRSRVFSSLLERLKVDFVESRLQAPEATSFLNILAARGIPFELGEPTQPAVRQGIKFDVVICVHNALADVRQCLESFVRHPSRLLDRIILVNDGSDRETTNYLRSISKDGNLRILLLDSQKEDGQKKRRLFRSKKLPEVTATGYTKAANRGLRVSTAEYVILLNSDTIITPGWLERLLICGESDQSIGIIGPLSNAASWQSVPERYDSSGDWIVNELPADISLNRLAVLFSNIHQPSRPRVPLLNGFCFAIKREVIETIGLLDEEAFPNGYGEENDFCLRAGKAGFDLAIADDCYVFHAKSKSYTHETRRKLSKAARVVLLQRYGEELQQATSLLRDCEALEKAREAFGALTYSPRPCSILFLANFRGSGGGIHSVIQEACGLRKLGAAVQVAIRAKDETFYRSQYASAPQDLFYVHQKIEELSAYASAFEFVVATLFTSVRLLQEILKTAPTITPCYYIQDYEPRFFEAKDEYYNEAVESYTLIPGMRSFAKTEWLVEAIKKNHGVDVYKVCPSIDREIYFPDESPKPGSPFLICAMVRPGTERRGPQLTFDVLRNLKLALGDRVSIEIFGVDPSNSFFAAQRNDFRYSVRGVLKREGVASLLRESSLFIDASSYQAFGRTGLEAMACRCATILPADCGTSEYAVDGLNTTLVDPTSVGPLFDAAMYYFEHEDFTKTIIEEGLKTANTYSVENACRSELSFFESLRIPGSDSLKQ